MAHDLGTGDFDGRHDLLAELDANRDALQTARGLVSMRLDAGVVVRPANVCDRDTVAAEGRTRELRRLGTSCVVSTPVAVGSLFHLTFDAAVLDLPAQVAMCDKCVMWSETAFEVHFKFVHEITLPDSDGAEPVSGPAD